MILLVVDTQKLITNQYLYAFDTFVKNVKELIKTARENQIEVIYVRHDDGGGSELTNGTDGFEIYSEFAPLSGEKIFDKTVNSAFKESGLLEYLNEIGEREILLVGLQTDYCIDATVKCGFEHGYHMIIPAHSNSTMSNQYMTSEMSYKYYNEFIWNTRYAECITLEDTLRRMRKH